jgi:hypothetical protein
MKGLSRVEVRGQGVCASLPIHSLQPSPSFTTRVDLVLLLCSQIPRDFERPTPLLELLKCRRRWHGAQIRPRTLVCLAHRRRRPVTSCPSFLPSSRRHFCRSKHLPTSTDDIPVYSDVSYGPLCGSYSLRVLGIVPFFVFPLTFPSLHRCTTDATSRNEVIDDDGASFFFRRPRSSPLSRPPSSFSPSFPRLSLRSVLSRRGEGRR